MLSDEDDRFVRCYEVPYDMSLLDFHEFICDDLGYDANHMASFYLSNANWEKIREFTLMDMGHDDMDEFSPVPMEEVILGQIIRNKRDRLIYLFDMFGDRSLFLELQEAKEQAPDTTYPCVTLSEGEAPEQFDVQTGRFDMLENGSEDSIFAEAMGDFTEFEGSDDYDDE